MKRTVCLLLACLLIFGASAMALGMKDLSGTWALTAVDYNGISYTPDEAGISMQLVLNANGTCTLEDGTNTLSYAWTLDGTTVLIDGGSVACVYDQRADQLLIDRSGLTLRLSRAVR